MTGPGDRSGEDAAQGATAPGGGFRKGAFGVSGSGDTSGFGGLVRVEPGGAVALHSTDRPYGGYFDEVTDALIDAVGQTTYDAAVQRVLVDRGEITYFVAREHLLTLVQALRDDEALRFELCSSVSGVDYEGSGGPQAGPGRPRLHVVLHLTSMTYRRVQRTSSSSARPRRPTSSSCASARPRESGPRFSRARATAKRARTALPLSNSSSSWPTSSASCSPGPTVKV